MYHELEGLTGLSELGGDTDGDISGFWEFGHD
jgi:hypothetical protein